jgi:hypothetical protein
MEQYIMYLRFLLVFSVRSIRLPLESAPEAEQMMNGKARFLALTTGQ